MNIVSGGIGGNSAAGGGSSGSSNNSDPQQQPQSNQQVVVNPNQGQGRNVNNVRLLESSIILNESSNHNQQNPSNNNNSLSNNMMGFHNQNHQNQSHNHLRPKIIKYIYDIPFFDRKELYRTLDENNDWENLGGGVMGYSSAELAEFGRSVYRGASPTESLLTTWGNQNHTILELFILLRKIGHFRGMRLLAKFVEPKYHVYIKDPELNATVELIQLDTKANIGGGDLINGQIIPGENQNLVDLAEIKNDRDGKKIGGASLGLVESVGHLPQIPYEELLNATGNWERRHILGKGGFGTVFKGHWKNTAVAIKRMEHRANHIYIESQLKQSLGELKYLNSYRHDNILPLYGYCLDGQHPCLVYQFMSNGSLEDRLLCRQKTMPLNWNLRYQITRGVACGIQFLHSIGPKPLIHGDIKSANILLDRNFEPKVGDFGLAREMDPSSAGASYVKVSRVHGTRPYLPDEYLRSKKLSIKVDSFSFGVMLFEICTGQRAYEESRQKKFLKDMIEEYENCEHLKDPKAGPENGDFFWVLTKLGKTCTQKLARDRPDMIQVLKSLEGIYSQASYRTISSHVTGLPFLFETPNSRAASLMPTGFSTNRLSPIDLRAGAGSPYWPTIQQNKQIHNDTSSVGSSVRRSPLPSSPQPPISHNYIPISNNQTPNTTNTNRVAESPIESPHFHFQQHQYKQDFYTNNPNNIISQSTTSGQELQNQKNFTPIVLNPNKPSDQMNQIRVVGQIIDVNPEDKFIPLVVPDNMSSNSQFDDLEQENSHVAATVIPLITELGTNLLQGGLEENSTFGHASRIMKDVGAQYHQHIFSCRIDTQIDGQFNTISTVDVVPLEGTYGSESNPYGQGFTLKEEVLDHILKAQSNISPMTSRTWKIMNKDSINPITGQPVAWKLIPTPSQPLCAKEGSYIRNRAQFAENSLWVTPFKDKEKFAAGFYVNQSKGYGHGLLHMIEEHEKEGRTDLVQKDLVIWHSFGVTHIPRVEDFPVMPSETCGFTLKPCNFFTCNPALDVPPKSMIGSKSENEGGKCTNRKLDNDKLDNDSE